MRENIIEVIANKEEGYVQAGKVKVKEFPRWLFRRHMSKTMSPPIELAMMVTGHKGGRPKERNKELCEALGMSTRTYYKLFVANCYEVFIDEHKDFIYKYCIGSSGRPSPHKLEVFNSNKTMLLQAQKDGQHNIIPILMATQKSPQQLKKELGKGTWKKLCSNSHWRNRQIAELMSRGRNTDQAINNMVHLSTTYLCRFDIDPRGPESSVWLDGQLRKKRVLGSTNPREAIRQMDIFRDTESMAVRLGENFSTSWSIQKMKDKHEEFKEKIHSQRYSKKPLDILKDRVKTKEYEGYVGKLLESPYAIWEEGDAMKHCVSMYSTRVAEGNYLVYSIRDKEGKRVSTLGIERVRVPSPIIPHNNPYVYVGHKRMQTPIKYAWRIQQHYGPCNRPVQDEDVKELANTIVEALNEKVKSLEQVA